MFRVFMDNKLLKCGVVGGVIVFIWCLISWMILPWHELSLKQFKDEKRVYEAIRDNAPVSGVYILPNMYVYRDGMSKSDMNKMVANQQEMMAKGPVMFACISRDGVKGSIRPFVISLIIQIIGGLIITWMLLQTKFNAFKKQVTFVTVAGVLVGILGVLPAWNWWAMSMSYTLSIILDLVIGWFLAGIAISKLLKR